jgi:2-dehydro-3-deoxygalactonokinase
MIVVDWGSSSLRAFRLNTAGRIVDQRRAACGVLAGTDQFADVLQQQIAEWTDPLVVLAGMIGSRQGWVEVPYVECPTTLADIAAAMTPIDAPTLPDRSLWIVPGVLYRAATPNGVDVMRGEETQLCGLLQRVDTTRHVACLPGTHSKWVIIEHGRIESLFTAMTGELFELLRRHSLLARLMAADNDALDVPAFVQGIDRARQPGGLLNHLFSVRTSGLTGALQPAQLASYLSGLLIGHELLDSQWAEQARGFRVHLIGSPALLEPYSLAMRHLAIAVEVHDETLAAMGAHALARHRGLLDDSFHNTP